MNLRKISLFAATIFASFLISTKVSHAFEGSFELKNQVGTNDRCVAYVAGLENSNYKILFSCRDLNYPGGETLSYYIAWANPQAGGNPIRLGDLNLGSAEFQTNKALSSIFVTREADRGTRNPSTNVVMKGNFEKSDFLASSQSPEVPTKPAQSPSSTPQSEAKVTQNPITNILKTASVFAIIGLVALIGLVFFLARPRA
ncbi:MAG: hypothetical protein HY044_00055 [Candidatus Woesebacteria bacterium]|nr:MAG: hypothetical protein HY044_00055 [Candidatus Woesebacteria bacterium]